MLTYLSWRSQWDLKQFDASSVGQCAQKQLSSAFLNTVGHHEESRVVLYKLSVKKYKEIMQLSLLLNVFSIQIFV